MFLNNNEHMPIVSISLTEEILKEIDSTYKKILDSLEDQMLSEQEFEVLFLKKNRKENLSGKVNAILLVVHNDEYDNQVNGIKHSYEDLITTHLHSKIEGDKCMELFMLKGEAELGK